MKRKLFAVAWIAGLPGIAVIALLPLPVLVADRALPVFLWVVRLASVAQNALLLALAVWAEVALAPKVPAPYRHG